MVEPRHKDTGNRRPVLTTPPRSQTQPANSVASSPAFPSAWVAKEGIEEVHQRQQQQQLHEEYQIPIRDAEASSPRQRRRRRRSEPSSGLYHDGNSSNTQREPETSLPDQIAASALAGTLELLKFAGGFTLNTTGKLVAPPLYVTRTLILPNLWNATVEILASTTPARLQDWFRIFRSSIYHFVDVLKNTPLGTRFRERIVIVGTDLLQSLAAEPSRQALIDGMSCLVKLADALHTPQVKELLDQTAVWGCRLVHATGHQQQLFHDVAALAWSICELVADPSTTLALAEVTAYLCYALEREDATMRVTSNNTRHNRRRERQEYQHKTYETSSLLRDPTVTVEQAILSSIGVTPVTKAHGEVPTSVVVDDASTSGIHDWEQASIRQQLEEHQSTVESVLNEEDETSVARDHPDLHDRARKDIDVPFLKRHIQQQRRRPNVISRRPDAIEIMTRPHRHVSLDDTGEIEGHSMHSKQSCIQLEGENTGKKHHNRNEWLQSDCQLPLPGESTIHHFNRMLDETLARKRKDAILEIITEYRDNPHQLLQRRGVVKCKDTGAHKSSVREQIRVLQSNLDAQLKGTDHQKLNDMKNLMTRNRNLVYLSFFIILLLVTTWLGLGVYGLYMLLRSTEQSHVMMPMKPTPPTLTSSSPNEIVIRVVREVVHVDASGKELSSVRRNYLDEGAHPDFSQNDLQRISQCVTQNIP